MGYGGGKQDGWIDEGRHDDKLLRLLAVVKEEDERNAESG